MRATAKATAPELRAIATECSSRPTPRGGLPVIVECRHCKARGCYACSGIGVNIRTPRS